MPALAPAQTESRNPGLWPRGEPLALLAAVLLWIIPMLVIAVIVVVSPWHRTVTQSYHQATAHWWAGENLYTGPWGMNYLPHFAVLYTSFHFLPLRLAEVLWRLCSAATLAGGLWLLIRGFFGRESLRPFFWATLVAMPLCLNSLRNGNANALFGGVVLLSIVAILKERWWLAAGLLALATAIKPLGIVLVLLAPLYYEPLRWRLVPALAGLAIFPFLFGSPAYVWGQHREAWGNLQTCAVVSEHRFADINGLLRTFGTELSPGASKLARALAGGFTAGLWWWGAKRLRGPLACLWLYALATAYLMLFNPMTEVNSYVIVSPALAAWAAFFLFSQETEAQRRIGWAIIVAALTMALLPNLLRPVFGNYFALFWHPLMAIVFLGLLLRFVGKSAPAVELSAQPA